MKRQRTLSPYMKPRNVYGPRAQLAATVIQRAYRAYRQRKAKSTYSSGHGVTTQHDRQRIYRYKKMPYKKKKSWVKFTKKVKATLDKELPTRTQILNDPVIANLPGPVAGQYNQALIAVHLYGKDGVNTPNEVGCNDMIAIKTTESGSPPNGSNFAENGKITFLSAILDITFYVAPPNESAGQLSSNVFEVDLYDIVYGKQDTTFSNLLTDASSTAFSNTGAIGVGAFPPQILARGVTPFDCGELISQTKMKILKKEKYFISAGQAVTYQVRVPRNYHCKGRDMISRATLSGDFSMEGMTRTILLIGKPVDRAWSQDNVFVCNATRSYKYNIPNPLQGVSGRVQ